MAASGELFVMILSTSWTHKLPALNSDLGDFLLAVKLSFVCSTLTEGWRWSSGRMSD